MRYLSLLVLAAVPVVSALTAAGAASAQGNTAQQTALREQQTLISLVDSLIPQFGREARQMALFGECNNYRLKIEEIEDFRWSLERGMGKFGSLPEVARNQLATKINQMLRTMPPCSGATVQNGATALPGGFSMSVGGNIGTGTVKADSTQYLGLANPLTGTELRGIVKPSQNTSVNSAGATVSVGLPGFVVPRISDNQSPVPRDRVFFTYNYFNGTSQQAFGNIDPRGERLLIPGTGDPNAQFPAGVSLGGGVPLGTPGGANVAQNIFYDRSITSNTFGVKFAASPFLIGGGGPPGPPGAVDGPVVFPSVVVTPIIGLDYNNTEFNERFSFSVPGFATDVAYNSNVKVNTFTPYVGGRVDVPLFSNQTTLVSGFVKGTAGIAISDASGNDRFNMNGFLNTNQYVPLNGDNTSFAGSIGGGIQVENGPVVFFTSVTHTQAQTAVNVIRTGEAGRASVLDFVTESKTTYSAGIRVQNPFTAERPFRSPYSGVRF